MGQHGRGPWAQESMPPTAAATCCPCSPDCLDCVALLHLLLRAAAYEGQQRSVLVHPKLSNEESRYTTLLQTRSCYYTHGTHTLDQHSTAREQPISGPPPPHLTR